MKFGASTFIWASPFSNDTLDLVDKVARLGFDLIEVCVEDPATIDTGGHPPAASRRPASAPRSAARSARIAT